MLWLLEPSERVVIVVGKRVLVPIPRRSIPNVPRKHERAFASELSSREIFRGGHSGSVKVVTVPNRIRYPKFDIRRKNEE
jgi:hypothetical protein